MSAADHLATYAEGWVNGDADTILKAVSDTFTFDDPNAGVVSKGEFSNYFAGVKQTVASLRGAESAQQFMSLSEIVTQETEGVLTAWSWWAIPETDIKGGGLIKVGSEGVLSEVITYYTKLPG